MHLNLVHGRESHGLLKVSTGGGRAPVGESSPGGTRLANKGRQKESSAITYVANVDLYITVSNLQSLGY